MVVEKKEIRTLLISNNVTFECSFTPTSVFLSLLSLAEDEKSGWNIIRPVLYKGKVLWNVLCMWISVFMVFILVSFHDNEVIYSVLWIKYFGRMASIFSICDKEQLYCIIWIYWAGHANILYRVKCVATDGWTTPLFGSSESFCVLLVYLFAYKLIST